MTSIFLIFPTQLFEDISNIKTNNIYLIEDPIYFTDYKFHKLKLAYHRATMKYYYDYLKINKFNVKYIDFYNVTIKLYSNIKVDYIYIYNPIEHLLIDKLQKIYKEKLIILETLNFLMSDKDIEYVKYNLYEQGFTEFYKYQRKKFNILLTKDNKPIGGKWSYDIMNRQKLPININIPKKSKVINNKYTQEAIIYINKHFKNNYGEISFIYPITHKESKKWLNNFLKNKLSNFGLYQDAVTKEEPFLFHSVLSPLLNIGLLTDRIIIKKTINYYNKNYNYIELQNIEGFIRQVIGWRNYIMVAYMKDKPNLDIKLKDTKLYHKLWQGETNMYPIDYIIKNHIIPYSYAHHILRLMYLGNYMKLCMINKELIYRMFMEWTIDSGNVFMYANIYGMVLNEIPLMKKNYIASSNYIHKLSNFQNDEWEDIFDGLYYNYIFKNFNVLKSDYGLRYQISYINKMTKKNKELRIDIANKYLLKLKS